MMSSIDTPRHQGMRKKLVEGLKIKGIRDEKVLEALLNVPRHAFMDSSFVNFATVIRRFR
jgi:protein-L-isoaspartate(D-aspartate) O-methyltransferase